MHRDIPQTPEDHPDFWPIWKQAIGERHPEPIDAVFGSENYVHRLAEELNAEAILVDPDRSVTAVSANDIRKDPVANWHFIPPEVRGYYQRRVCLLGPESSGKSILAAHLARTFDATLMPEYGRTYDAAYRKGTGWEEGDFVCIARTHAAMRKAVSRRGHPVVIEDTDAIQTAIWAQFLLPGLPELSGGIMRDSEPADLYLILSAEAVWQDDGTRYSGDQDVREFFVEEARRQVQKTGRPVVEVSGNDWVIRTQTAEAALRTWLKT
ncbi:MAG: AAA family ATPase [Hyphomicrobiales bacterium]